MSVPPIDIAAAVRNTALRDESSIMVNVGELRKLIALAGQAQRPPADDLADAAAEPLHLADVDAAGNAD